MSCLSSAQEERGRFGPEKGGRTDVKMNHLTVRNVSDSPGRGRMLAELRCRRCMCSSFQELQQASNLLVGLRLVPEAYVIFDQ